MNNIFLYGPPASGKTTLGQRLAARLGATFVDLDAEIVERAGKTIPDIFAQDGEAAFRDLESAVLAKVVTDDASIVALGGGTHAKAARIVALGGGTHAKAARIVALGGGTLLREENRKLCEANGTVICLEAPSAAELQRRIGEAAGSRPLGDKAQERAAHYATFPHRIADSFEAGPSLVVVGNGIAATLVGDTPYVVDENVAAILDAGRKTEDEGMGRRVFTIPSGEQNKTIGTVAKIWHAFAEAGLGRRDVVAAVGGGVTGDLTGFAAATWMRGMDWVNVPTTLLSMVDASTGGKTGCDLPEGKNLAGAFHAPRMVVIDTDFLKTLPPRELACGKAEMVKHEIIKVEEKKVGGGGESRKKVGGGGESRKGVPSARQIAENLKVKVKIVEEDPFETKGRRILLNCGHTVGHAVEKLTNYAVSHGEAVAIGCVEEARFAERLGLAQKGWADEVAVLLRKAGLPTELPGGIDFEAMKPIMRGDKKRKGDIVTFALPCGWGDVRGVEVNLESKK